MCMRKAGALSVWYQYSRPHVITTIAPEAPVGGRMGTVAWLSAQCLCKGRLELDIIWDQVPAASAVRTEPLNPSSASEWRMHVIDPAHAQPYGHSIFSLSVSTHIWLHGMLCA